MLTELTVAYFVKKLNLIMAKDHGWPLFLDFRARARWGFIFLAVVDADAVLRFIAMGMDIYLHRVQVN